MDEDEEMNTNKNCCSTSTNISNTNDNNKTRSKKRPISSALPLLGRVKTHRHLLDRYKSTVLKEKTVLVEDEKKRKKLFKLSNRNFLDERSNGNDDNNDNNNNDNNGDDVNEKEQLLGGWTMEDMLHMNVEHDCFPEEYGIDFMEDGYKSIHNDSIIQHMPIPQISDLVGLANSASSSATTAAHSVNSNSSNRTMTNNSTKTSIKKHPNCTSIQQVNDRCNDQAKATKEYDKFVETRMWHMSNTTPPKPSHLNFLLQCASHKILQSQTEAEQIYSMYQESCKQNYVDMTEDAALVEDKISNNVNATITNSIVHNNEGGIIHKNQNKTIHVQSANNNMTIEENAKKSLKQKSKQLEKLYNKFDETALVALGMFMEESFIASLLPLARDHVTRCRYLEKRKLEEGNGQHLIKKKKKKNHNKELECDDNGDDLLEEINDPFVQWTLPAEEAISNLAFLSSGGNHCIQKTSQFMHTPSNKSPHNHVNTIKRRQELRNWCVAHGIDQNFAMNNLDLLKSFFQDPSKQVLHDLYNSSQSKCVNDVKKALIKASTQNDNEFLDNHVNHWSIPQIHVDADK